MTVLLVVGALVVGAPLAAAVLVTLASHREEMAHTLAGRPPGIVAAAARVLLGLRVGGLAYPRRRSVRPRERGPESYRSDDRTLTRPRS